LLIEMLTPGGFFFLFFGVAALVTGGLASAGVGPDWLLLLVFSVLSVGSLLVFRGPLVRLAAQKKSSAPVDALAGESVVLTEDLAAGGLGQGELRGTVWKVQNGSSQALSKGQRCRIERAEGLKLIVGPET
jgi:membrane protein implicated in regulation of membrane protease activity